MEAGLAGEGRQVEMEPRLYVIIPCYNEEIGRASCRERV